MLQNASNVQQTLTDGQDTNTAKKKRYSPDKLLVVNYVKFHLTILTKSKKKKKTAFHECHALYISFE